MRRPLVVLAGLAIAVAAGVGVTTAALDAGPQSLEARTQAVASTLRCPTCDNLPVADSPSPMAGSMRAQIARQLEEGRSPDQVREWFVDRYGPWVLLSPPREGVSLLVWLAPAAVLLVAAGIGVWLLRGRRTRSPPPDVDVERLRAAWRAGELDIPDSPTGERLEAALRWLDEERASASPGPRRLAAAADEAAGAWQALQAAPRDRPGGRRPLGWAAGGLVLLAAIAAALPTAVAARGIGGVATGSTPGGGGEILAEQDGPAGGVTDLADGASSPEEAVELIAELERVAVAEDDPAAAAEAVAARLPAALSSSDRLTMGLLALQHDHVAAADALAVSVLAEDGDNLEGVLLRGLTLTFAGDDAGADWLQRFVDAAPAEHPGRPLAENALANQERQR